MPTIHTQLAVIEIAVQQFTVPGAPLPVIAAPIAWMRGVAAALGQPDYMVPQSIHGCAVVQKEGIDEPVVVTADGKAYRVSLLIAAPSAATQ